MISSPLFSFESAEDYALDAQWSPSHPAIFASADGEGYLDLWDLNKETEEPLLHYKTGDRAINKIKWSLDGKRLAAGTSDGNLQIYEADKDVKVSNSQFRFLTQGRKTLQNSRELSRAR